MSLILYTLIEVKINQLGNVNMNKQEIVMQTCADARNEIKQRITQRDNFAVQYIIITVTILTVAFSNYSDSVSYVTFALLPLLTDFYTFLIDSSYKVHTRLVEYLNSEIEPEIEKKFTGIRLWEHYCKDVRRLEGDSAFGGRQQFFHMVTVCMPVLTLILQYSTLGINIVFTCYTVIMLIISIIYLYSHAKTTEYTGLNKLAFCDYEKKERLTDEPNKAIFFDRDGTLHVDKIMTHRLRDLELLPGAKELVNRAHDLGYKVIIITNQSAIGKGYYSKFRMHLFNYKLRLKLKYVDSIYYCPHTKDVKCNCRKPKTGMIDRAKMKYNLDLQKCIVVGDRMSDICTADNAGIPNRYFVTTGIYNGNYSDEPHFYDVKHKTVDSLTEIELNE